MRIWLLEDDDMCAETIMELLVDLLPQDRIDRFRDVRETTRETAGPDIALIDVSAVCSLSQLYMFADLLWPFGRKWPGTSIIVLSGLANAVEDDVSEMFAEHGITNHTQYVSMGCGLYERLCEALQAAGATVVAAN